MAYNPNWPPLNAELISADFRAQFQGLKALIDAAVAAAVAAAVPIGTVLAWDKNLPGVPALPEGWLECNGQTINDPASPLNGLNTRDLNGAQGGVAMFLRGAIVSGTIGGSETHSHGLPLNVNGGTVQQGADVTIFPPGTYTSDPASSFPPYCDMVLIVKVK